MVLLSNDEKFRSKMSELREKPSDKILVLRVLNQEVMHNQNGKNITTGTIVFYWENLTNYILMIILISKLFYVK